MFKCDCGNTKFTLTDVTTTTTTILLDTDLFKDINLHATVKHIQGTTTYTLTCTKCGKSWTYTDIKPQNIPGGIFFDFDAVLKNIKKKGMAIPASTNMDD